MSHIMCLRAEGVKAQWPVSIADPSIPSLLSAGTICHGGLTIGPHMRILLLSQ